MICGGSFRKKRFLTEDIYGFLPNANKLRDDENEENGFREVRKIGNSSERKEKVRISRSNSLRNNEDKPSKDSKKRGIFRSNSFRIKSLLDRKSDESQKKVMPKSILKKNTGKYNDFSDNPSICCDNQQFFRTQSLRAGDFHPTPGDRLDVPRRHSFRGIHFSQGLGRIDENINRNSFRPIDGVRSVRIDSNVNFGNETYGRHHPHRNLSVQTNSENLLRTDDRCLTNRNSFMPINEQMLPRIDDNITKMNESERNSFRPINNHVETIRIDENLQRPIIAENGLPITNSSRLANIEGSLRATENVYEDKEFIRANSFRIKQQCEDKAVIVDETKEFVKTSSFMQRYERLEEDQVSENVSVDSSNPEEVQEELEGSLRARIYRKHQTVVIVCRNKGLERVGSGNGGSREVQMRPLSSDLNPPRMDCYRFSMVNMEDSQDVDLEAILGELNALDSQFEEALQSVKNDAEVKEEVTSSVQSGAASARTHSPDNDSAFSDCVSLLSSESSASSGRSTTDSHCPGEQISNSKAEKIKLALQKMKEASVKKLFVKVFNEDSSAKCLLVDEGMTCGYVTRILAEKNHTRYSPSNALVEHLTDLHMKRVYDDDELLVDQLMEWTRDSKNRLIFSPEGRESHARTLLFTRPHSILYSTPPSDNQTDKSNHPYTVLEEFFASNSTPSVEGPLYIKTDSKKGWKKHHCVLRASGLYFYPKDRTKSSSKDLVCLATFDNNQVYYGIGWRKKYKAPTDFCFALKHPTIQQLTNKSSKYIKYLCADDEFSMEKWIIAIRVIKRGRQLLVNHKAVTEQAFGGGDDISVGGEHRISVCVSERSDTAGEFLTTTRERGGSCGSNTLHRVESDSGSSSGCDMAFEADFPQGTIKRKPPKLPLTATTRQLKEIAIGTPVLEEERLVDECEGLPPPPPELLEPPSMEYPEPPPPPPPPRTQPRQSQLFLQDLARVMSKKWQVAQKCKMEVGTSPHEVLGFRDPDDYSAKETSVSQWVAEHYGSSLPQHFPPPLDSNPHDFPPAPPQQMMAPSLYENVYRAAPVTAPACARPVQRRPPPPPPRALTTHLTTVSLQQNS